jgi:RNA polymerase sigma-70 factor (ECF subfamily)
MPVLYAELHQMARAFMRKERHDHTLQPTALVHEAYLRLAVQQQVDWTNRAQVFGLAARMMRRVLADYAGCRNAIKRMGRLSRAALDEAGCGVAANPDPGIEFMDLNRALERLEQIDPQMASIVELRFFGGLTIDEAAEVTGLSTATVEREWSTARVWILRHIHENGIR